MKTQINLYCDATIPGRMDALISAYNENRFIGAMHSRGELLEALVLKLERYREQHDDMTSFFEE